MASPPITVLSVCTGSRYLDLGVELAIGQETCPVLFCEGEGYAAKVLAKRMEEGLCPSAPIWSDLNTLTSKTVRSYVGEFLRGRPLGGFVGGIPCQPWSDAGKGLGLADARDLWPPSLRAIEVYQPGFVFLENVRGFLKPGGVDRVCQDLERLGYRCAVGMFSAKEVGASHRRERIFILGVSEGHDQRRGGPSESDASFALGGSGRGLANPQRQPRSPEQQFEPGERADQGTEHESVLGPAGGGLVNPKGDGRGEGRAQPEVWSGRDAPSEPSGGLAKPDCKRRKECFVAVTVASKHQSSERGSGGMGDTTDDLRRPRIEGVQRGAGRGRSEPSDPSSGMANSEHGGLDQGNSGGGWEAGDSANDAGPRIPDPAGGDKGSGFPLFAPGRNAWGPWRDVLDGKPYLAPALTDEEAESILRGIPNGLVSWNNERIDRLRMGGNGVVPLCAAYAFVSLWACLRADDF